MRDVLISIHAPPRGATARREGKGTAGYISIHAPPRGATKHLKNFLHITLFQFTPLREGRPSWLREIDSRGAISIHAPPRGATVPAVQRRGRMENFNSRPSARGDTFAVGEKYLRKISIHAPPRGATERRKPSSRHKQFQFTPLREGRRYNSQKKGRTLKYFNSRPSARGDRAGRYNSAERERFQFTPLREGRHVRRVKPGGHPYFNSRPSARGDRTRSGRKEANHDISIHAPPRGATVSSGGGGRASRRISIHAPPRGATISIALCVGQLYFNSRPSARGDSFLSKEFASMSISIHAPPRGATIADFPNASPSCISIHAPPRGATGNALSADNPCT